MGKKFGEVQIDELGTKLWYDKNGKLHREGGPAIEHINGNKYWYKNGELHRLDGPAVEKSDGRKEYWVGGVEYSKLEFDRLSLKKQPKFLLKYANLNKLNDLMATSYCKISPSHIDCNKKWSSFGFGGDLAMLASARFVVILCQNNSGWKPFRRKEIQNLYVKLGNHGRFMFNGLLVEEYILRSQRAHERGYYFVTKSFASECLRAAPKTGTFKGVQYDGT